jgi:hypothetical protein
MIVLERLETTLSCLARKTNVGTWTWRNAAVSSAASSSAIRRRTTGAETPDIARFICEGALLGDTEPHINGARTQRGKPFTGRYCINRRAQLRQA